METPQHIEIPDAADEYDSIEVREMTSAGIGIAARLPAHLVRAGVLRAIRLQLESGPYLAAFDAGMCDMMDVAPKSSEHVVLAVLGERPIGPRARTQPLPYTTLKADAASWLARMRLRDEDSEG